MLHELVPDAFWGWFQWALTILWLVWVTGTFLRIRERYRSASQGIIALKETYDAIIDRAQAAALAAQDRIELTDTEILLARVHGIGRKIKLHDRCRRERERLRFLVEEAKSRTESLPIIGILGTILGLVIASLGQESIQAITGGIWIALTSSLFALAVMLVAKYRWEARVLSQLENLEDREALVFEYVSLWDPDRKPEPAA